MSLIVLILTILWISEVDSSIKNRTIGTKSSNKHTSFFGSNDSKDISSIQQYTADSITNSSKSLMWEEVNHLLEKGTKSVIDALNLANVISAANISDECERSLKIFLDEFSQWKSWAVQMVDANAKLPSGILEGRVMSLGSFDQCLRIRFETADLGTAFRGRYCLVRYTTPLLKDIYAEGKYGARNEEYAKTYGQPPEWIEDFIMKSGSYLKDISFWMGTCVPSTCSEDDVKEVISHVLKSPRINITVENCQMDEPMKWSINSIIALAFLSLLFILCIVGTVVDIRDRLISKFSEPKRWFLHWIIIYSLFRNTKKCFENKTSSSKFAFFNGLRIMSFTWIVINHTWSKRIQLDIFQYSNFLKIDEDAKGYFIPAMIDGAHASVDTFFFMSGFLLVYTTWKKLDVSGGRLNLFKFMALKYWRLTPSLGLIISMFLILFQMGSGPIQSGFICLLHTWFLAALLQLHLIGVILLLIAYRWPTAGVLLGSSIFVGSTVYLALVTIWNGYLMPSFFVQKDLGFLQGYMKAVHIKTYSHINPYFVGMLFGYVILKRKEIKMKSMYRAMFCVMAAVLSIYVIYGKYWSFGKRELVITYHAIQRTAWALSLGWLTYSLHYGHAVTVNRFLSWPGFAILSNFTYLAYLFHSVIILAMEGSMRELNHYSELQMISECIRNIIASLILSFVSYVAIEMPFTTIGKIIFKK